MRVSRSRPRFIGRCLMIAVPVAVLATALTIPDTIERRREHFRQLARFHSDKAESYGNSGFSYRTPGWTTGEQSESDREWSRRVVDLGFYHIGLVWKYRTAADRPWLPVWPDPPEPE